jgi:hypothetical protein
MKLKEKEIQQKNNLAQLLTFFLFFLVIWFLLIKLILIKKKFEKDFVLFITKELVFLSFVEAYFFQKINSKAKFLIEFPIKESFKMNFCL